MNPDHDEARPAPVRFPILTGRYCQQHRADLYVPWAMIQPCEAQALSNHSQSLKRLAERGGLSANEAIWVLSGLGWRDGVRASLPQAEAEAELMRRVREWESKP